MVAKVALYRNILGKTRWELLNNYMSDFEQIRKAAPFKIAAIRLLSSYQTNYPNMTRQTSQAKEEISDILRWTPTHGHTGLSQTTKLTLISIVRILLKDFPRAIDAGDVCMRESQNLASRLVMICIRADNYRLNHTCQQT